MNANESAAVQPASNASPSASAIKVWTSDGVAVTHPAGRGFKLNGLDLGSTAWA